MAMASESADPLAEHLVDRWMLELLQPSYQLRWLLFAHPHRRWHRFASSA